MVSWAGSRKHGTITRAASAICQDSQNIAASTNYRDPQGVVDMWMSETAWYHYATNSCDSGQECGHYTQIVWRDTKRVGCAVARGREREVWVCNYDPPGNWAGRRPY